MTQGKGNDEEIDEMLNEILQKSRLLTDTKQIKSLGGDTVYTCGVCGEGWGTTGFDISEAKAAIQSLLERRELEARIDEVSTALNAYDPSQPSYVLKTIGEYLTKRLIALRSERQAETGEAPNVPL